MDKLFCMARRSDGKLCSAVHRGLDTAQLRGPVVKPDLPPYVCVEWYCPNCGALMLFKIVHSETGEVYGADWLVNAAYGVSGIDRDEYGQPIHKPNRLAADRKQVLDSLRSRFRQRRDYE